MKEAGLIDASCRGNSFNRDCLAKSLTWDGHEFLDQIRSDAFWSQTASTIKTKGLEVTFETIKATATALVKRVLAEL